MNKKKIKGGKNNSLLSHGLIINNIDKKLSRDIYKKLSRDIYEKISNIIIQNDKNNKNISFNFTKINANKKNLDNIYNFYIIDKIFNNYNKTNKGILKSDNILYGGKNRRLIKGGAKIEGIKDDLIKYCSTITEKIRSNTDYTDDNKFITPYLPSVDFAVDGSHPGLMHNTQYSNKLFDWVSIKYPNMFTLNNYETKLL